MPSHAVHAYYVSHLGLGVSDFSDDKSRHETLDGHHEAPGVSLQCIAGFPALGP